MNDKQFDELMKKMNEIIESIKDNSKLQEKIGVEIKKAIVGLRKKKISRV